jgi:hypothetical protein
MLIMNEEQMSEVHDYIKDNLRINVKTTRKYTGGDPLYADVHTLQLVLCDEIISEDSIS